MLMTMGVLNEHDYKHELITLRKRTFFGIIERIEEMQFSNDEVKTLTTYIVIYKMKYRHILDLKKLVHDPF